MEHKYTSLTILDNRDWEWLTPESLEKICIGLFGKRWKKDLSKELEVSPYEIECWLLEKKAIPRNVSEYLEHIIRERIRDLTEYLNLIGEEKRSMDILGFKTPPAIARK